MSTALTWQTDSTSFEATLELAESIGKKLCGGEVIELVSDLGGGKTAFVRGLAKGIGSQDAVRSPSFTLSNEYHTDTLVIHHFDFYRLKEPGIMLDELSEILNDPSAVVVIEWAGIVEDILTAKRLTIHFLATDENSRQLTFEYPVSLAYLFPKHLTS